MPLGQVYLNGHWMPIEKASISPMDRGFLFADGCYEVIPVYQRKIFRLSDHVQRLSYSLEALQIETGYSEQDWLDLSSQSVKQAGEGFDNGYIYLQVTRGASHKRDHSVTADLSPTVFSYVEGVDFASYTKLSEPIHASLVEDFRWHRGDIKTISLLGAVMARKQAMDAGFDDCIFHREGYIVETSASNLFIVEHGVVKTPPLSNFLLGGITRLVVLELLAEKSMPFSVEPISVRQLQEADEVFLTSSTKELVPITKVDDRAIGNAQVGKILSQLWTHWQQYIQQYVG